VACEVRDSLGLVGVGFYRGQRRAPRQWGGAVEWPE
jgi:hypothetical protein